MFNFREPSAYTNVALSCSKSADSLIYSDVPLLGKKLGYFNIVFRTYKADAKTTTGITNIPTPHIKETAEGVLIIKVDEEFGTVERLLMFLETGKTPSDIEFVVNVAILAAKWKLVDYYYEMLLNRIRAYKDWTKIAHLIVNGGMEILRDEFIQHMIINAVEGSGKILANINDLEQYIDCKTLSRMNIDELCIFLVARYGPRPDLKFNLPIIFKNVVFTDLTKVISVMDACNTILAQYRQLGNNADLLSLRQMFLEIFELKVRESKGIV
jgi:hypothetical protein